MDQSINSNSTMPGWGVKYRWLLTVMGGILGLSLLPACTSLAPTPTPTPPPLAKELIYYDWADDIPQSVWDAFTAEYGVKVTYLTYESQEEAIQNIRAGVVYDVVVMENQLIPELIAERLLAEIDPRNVPNFKNISANFRDLASDPSNRHTVPATWGTSGLIVRSDLVQEPVTRWADLWEAAYSGRIVGWNLQRYLIGIALKSLGYSVNSENPAELEAALKRLVELRSKIQIVEYAPPTSDAVLAGGEVVITYGWAGDVLRAQAKNQAITYVLPEEGTILWGDNWVIPTNSPNKYTAQLLLNFLLRPDMAAQIANYNYYATANEAALPLIKPEILNDPVIFPPEEALKHAEVLFPLSPQGQKLYKDIWIRFLAEGQK